MFQFAFVGVAAGGRVTPCELSGSLSKTAAPSGGFVTSDTVTITVPGGNSGALTFASYILSGTMDDPPLQYSKNGGAWTALAEGTGITFASGDTLAVRAGGTVAAITAGESLQFSLIDQTTVTLLQTVNLVAS